MIIIVTTINNCNYFLSQLAKSITSRTTKEIFSSLVFVICITVYGFIPNHFAQEIINHSSDIFTDA